MTRLDISSTFAGESAFAVLYNICKNINHYKKL